MWLAWNISYSTAYFRKTYNCISNISFFLAAFNADPWRHDSGCLCSLVLNMSRGRGVVNLPSDQRGTVHPFPLILCVLVSDPKPEGVPVASGKTIPQKRLRGNTHKGMFKCLSIFKEHIHHCFCTVSITRLDVDIGHFCKSPYYDKLLCFCTE